MTRRNTTRGPALVALGALLLATVPARLAAETGVENLCQGGSEATTCAQCVSISEIDPNRNPFGDQLNLIQDPAGKVVSQRQALINARQIFEKKASASKIKDVNGCAAAVNAINMDHTAKGGVDCINVTITGHGNSGLIKVGENLLMTNDACTSPGRASEEPQACCTGLGSGTCTPPLSNGDCTSPGKAFGTVAACCTGAGTGNCEDCLDDIKALSGKICTLQLLGCSVAKGAPGQELLKELSLGLGGIPVKGWERTIFSTDKTVKSCEAPPSKQFEPCDIDDDCDDPMFPAIAGECKPRPELQNKFFEFTGTKKKLRVPTLSGWGLIGFGGLLLTAMFVAMQRRRA